MLPPLKSFFLSAAVLACIVLKAQDDAPTPRYEPAIKPKVVQLEDGRLDLGGVIVDPEKQTATFPVQLNDSNDSEVIEYLLVHENGKTHESLLRTTVQPFHLHTAMLLLGIERAGAPPRDTPPENVDDEWLAQAPPAEGRAVTMVAIVNGKRLAPEDWILDEKRGQTMRPGQWVYNGSYFRGVAFMAEADGSIAAIIADPAALLNCTDPQRIDDNNWILYSQAATFPNEEESFTLELTVSPPAVDAASESTKVIENSNHEH